MNYKRLTATLMATVMVAANGMTVMAAGVDGTGAVEYDNSVAVTYDKIQVPTLTGSKYNFTLDPTNALATYNSAEYTEDNSGVYFHSQKTAAKIEQQASTDANYKALYTLSKVAVAAEADDWKAVVSEVTADENKTPTVTAGYYVWTPADFVQSELADGTEATGKMGEYTELTASNIKTYFEIGEKDAQNKYTITAKADHLAGNCVFDGKLYKDTYTAMSAAISDNPPTNDFGEYVELNADGKTIKTVKGVYVEKDGNSGYELAAAANIKFTPAEIKYQATTDKVIVTNKSTNKKTVKAVVTMSNVDGLTFKDNGTFTGDKTASVFFKATDGTAANDAILAQGDTTATATYTLDVDGATVTPIKYQGGINPKTGGHNYFNYEAVGTQYNSNSFWLEAKANTNTDDDTKAAWKAYGKAVEDAYDETAGAATPSINIVYTVTDYVAAPTTYTVTYKANYTADPAIEDKAETVNVGTAPTATGISFTREGYTFKGWGTSATATEADKVTLSSISSAIDLYAIWEEDITDDYIMVAENGAYSYTFVTIPTGNITALEIDGTNRIGAVDAGNATYNNGVLGFNATMTNNLGLLYGNHTIAITIDETDYELTISNPVMTKSNGAFSYTFASAPDGEFTALTIDGTDREGAITAGNASYSDGVITLNATMVSKLSLDSSTHKIDATIGGKVYKLYISN